MSEPLIAPAVDGVVVAYLNGILAEPVSTKVPDSRPSAFVRVILTGGSGRRSTVLHDAQVTVEAWASTYAAASALMGRVDAYMHDARFANPAIRDVQSFGAPIELPAPSTAQFRMTATYQVTVRASAL